MPVADLVARGQEALLLAGALALPLVAIAAAAGLVTSALLGAAGVQDGAASQPFIAELAITRKRRLRPARLVLTTKPRVEGINH